MGEGELLHSQPARDFLLPEAEGGREHGVASCTMARVLGPFLQSLFCNPAKTAITTARDMAVK